MSHSSPPTTPSDSDSDFEFNANEEAPRLFQNDDAMSDDDNTFTDDDLHGLPEHLASHQPRYDSLPLKFSNIALLFSGSFALLSILNHPIYATLDSCTFKSQKEHATYIANEILRVENLSESEYYAHLLRFTTVIFVHSIQQFRQIHKVAYNVNLLDSFLQLHHHNDARELIMQRCMDLAGLLARYRFAFEDDAYTRAMMNFGEIIFVAEALKVRFISPAALPFIVSRRLRKEFVGLTSLEQSTDVKSVLLLLLICSEYFLTQRILRNQWEPQSSSMLHSEEMPRNVILEAFDLLEEIANSSTFASLERKENETLIPISEFNGDGLWSAVHVHPSLPTLIRQVIEYRRGGFSSLVGFSKQEFIDEMFFDVKPVWKCFPAIKKMTRGKNNADVVIRVDEDDD